MDVFNHHSRARVQTDHTPCKVYNIYSLDLYRKGLPIHGLTNTTPSQSIKILYSKSSNSFPSHSLWSYIFIDCCSCCYLTSVVSDSVRPRDGSPPGSSVPGILQARTLEWVAISFSNAWKWKVKLKSLSRVWLLATPRTAAHQALPSMGFSRQEYWSRVPLLDIPKDMDVSYLQTLSSTILPFAQSALAIWGPAPWTCKAKSYCRAPHCSSLSLET